MKLRAGERLGPYEVLSPLGAGGMGEVYRARDTRLGRAVAVKILTERLAESEAARQRFEREARAVAALAHPNIVALHDVGREGSLFFAVTELLEGETLQERLLRGPLPVRKVIEIGAAIAEGLSAAHAKGIVHRDLKPSNVFVTSDGHVKLLDFGLARQQATVAGADTSQSPTLSQTEPGTLLGTVGYMAPEQARGAAADARSDIFALGCVLYEMASGERAFARETAAETLAAILREEPRGLAQSGALPAELRAVIARCLEKQPDERFQSARDLAFALRSATSGELVRGDGSARMRPRWAGPRAVVAAAALLAVLLLVLVRDRGGLPLRGGTAPIRSIAVLPLQNLSGDAEQEYFADGLTEALITDLAKARSLKVISRTSIMQYKNVKKPLPEIARALGVEAVIEGSVLRSGGRVRVTAQLIDANSDRHLWAEEYERDLRDVLSLQREIARSIVREIHVALTPQEEARLSAARRRVVPESHEAYLKGRLHVSRFTEESITTAIGFFEKAIAADPLSAEAHAGLAMAHHELGIWGSVSPRATGAAARAAVARAMELDDSVAEAHCALGMISEVYDWEWVVAEREMKRAIELGGGGAACHQQYAVLLHVLRRFPEAIAESERARRLDPLSAPVASSAARVYYRARQHDRAIALYRESIALDPAYLPNYARLADVYLDLGRPEEALAALERGHAIGGVTRRQSEGFAIVFAALGRRKEATDILARFKEMASQGSDQVAWRIALIATALGHNDDAIAWLERAFAERSAGLFLVNAELKFDPLRSDPRFQALLRRMNFPD